MENTNRSFYNKIGCAVGRSHKRRDIFKCVQCAHHLWRIKLIKRINPGFGSIFLSDHKSSAFLRNQHGSEPCINPYKCTRPTRQLSLLAFGFRWWNSKGGENSETERHTGCCLYSLNPKKWWPWKGGVYKQCVVSERSADFLTRITMTSWLSL